MRSNVRGQSKSFESKRRRRFLITICIISIALSALIFGTSYLSFARSLAIHTIYVTGADPKIVPRMQSAAYQAIQGSYLGLFSRSNAIIFPANAIAREISSASPSVSSVKIKRTSLHTIDVRVVEKSGDAIICAELPDISSAPSTYDGCYLGDYTGYIYKKIGNNDPRSSNVYFIPELEGTDPLGNFATTTKIFQEIQDFVDDIRAANISVQATLIKSNGEYEVYANNPDSDSLVVIHASHKAGLTEEKDNLIAFWQKVVSDARAKKKTIQWNDIKLQYPPNVYYTEAQ